VIQVRSSALDDLRCGGSHARATSLLCPLPLMLLSKPWLASGQFQFPSFLAPDSVSPFFIFPSLGPYCSSSFFLFLVPRHLADWGELGDLRSQFIFILRGVNI
jgi:hypothetical protein